MAYQDRSRLTELGFLNDTADFQVGSRRSFLEELNPKDRALLKTMTPEFMDLRGKALLRQAYLNYPAFTCRSEILSETLSPVEIAYVRRSWNTDHSPCLFTIGYEGLTIDAYLNRLICSNIKAMVDVRSNPHSMKHDFRKNKLRQHLETVGIKYYHIPELGIPSDRRQSLDSPRAYQRLFREYENHVLPTQTQAIRRLFELFSQCQRVALTCFEADYRYCHRHKIAEYMEHIPSFEATVSHL
ncbi:MAG: DUF488 family protein [Dehalococcoidia bacterium]